MMLDFSCLALNLAREWTRNAVGGEKGSVVEAEIPGTGLGCIEKFARKGRTVEVLHMVAEICQ